MVALRGHLLRAPSATSARGFRLGFSLLFLFALLLGTSFQAQAASLYCSQAPFNGLVDGNNPVHVAALQTAPSIAIDTNCTFQNFPYPNNILNTQVVFDPNDGPYFAVFDNVYFDDFNSGFSCGNNWHMVWFTNSSVSNVQNNCIDFFIPVESIIKKNPAGQTTAAIGAPFTYSIKVAGLYFPLAGTTQDTASPSTLGNIQICDDLTAAATGVNGNPGAEMSYLSNQVYSVIGGVKTLLGSLTPTTTSATHSLCPSADSTNRVYFSAANNPILQNVPANTQIEIEMTVVLDDVPTNVPTTQFANTAKWWFSRWVDIDQDNVVDPGEFFEPLPGQWGITEPMTIVGPNLVVDKRSTTTALNLGIPATFTIDAQNSGGSTAYNATILDLLPPPTNYPGGFKAGMCDYDPTSSVTAKIVAADGVTTVANLIKGTDYSVTWSGTPSCQLELNVLTDKGKIGPNQHLIITYQSQLDSDTTAEGVNLTNYAGATEWFGLSNSSGHQYTDTVVTGTPALTDNEDAYTVTTGLSGYYFEKTVDNLTTGAVAGPAMTAAPGDTLHYTLRLFNVDQTFTNITIRDPLDLVNDFAGAPTNITTSSGTAGFNSTLSRLEVTVPTVPLLGELVVEFDITLKSTLANNYQVDNQATLSADGPFTTVSDDPFTTHAPYTNLVSSPDVTGDEDPTVVTILTPGPLAKATTKTTATIGEQFSYRVTVPATAVSVPLYDVRILDDLIPSAADMHFVSASVVSGGTWALTNTSGSTTNLIIADLATGIDIPAGGQAVIDITVQLDNTATNQRGLTFTNTASYTYNRVNGDNTTQKSGAAATTANMTVVEPAVTTAIKAVSFVSPATKNTATDPATVGDVLQYTVTIPNNGNATAFDTNIVDMLPTNVALVVGSATAKINNVAVSGFDAAPTTLPSGALAWGLQNGDGTLDIPAGQSLVLTYQVTVVSVTGASITNSVYMDWTSLQDAQGTERTGAGCPTITQPNDYCFVPTPATVATIDNTSLAKAIVTDSYAESPASTTDPVVRVGDTVTYELTLHLQETTTRQVVVDDVLPAGMALVSFTLTPSSNISYTTPLVAQPAAGSTGTLQWSFGDIANPPSNNGTPIDTLVIRYVAKVVTDAPAVGVDYDPSNLLDNQAQLSYTGGDPALNPALTATDRVEVRQPQMLQMSKVDLGAGRVGTGTSADPYQVNVVTDQMIFQLSSCNTGLAPAYGVEISDTLAWQLDESDLANPPLVKIGTTTLVAGSDFSYVAPVRGGTLSITLTDSKPVNPGQCVTVDYTLGFHTDVVGSSTWSNQAQVAEYRSLPLAQPDSRIYPASASAQVWMTNLVGEGALLKTLVAPASGEAPVGSEVVYRITVPAVAMNAALDNVVVTDTLHGALEYVSATATLNGAPLSPAITQSGQTLSLGLGTIPAGQQAVITLTTRVANNDQANAGTSFANTADYSYTGKPATPVTASTSAPVTIVEPLVTVSKTASATAPLAGDLVTYTLTFTAGGGVAGDDLSNAFDLTVEDSLSLGLLYEAGSATLNGAALADPSTNGGDGTTTAQQLSWSLASGHNIDIPEGTTITVTYQVRVLDTVSSGQTLTNSVIGRWTSLDGVSAFERNGSNAPALNDYFTAPATVTMTTPLTVTIVKSVVNATTGEDPGANAVPGNILRYTLVLSNDSLVPINNATLVDVLAAEFAPNTLQLVTVPAGADSSNTSATGGANGSGIVDIRNIALAPQGDPDGKDSVTIVFTATLDAVIDSGSTVLNLAQLSATNVAPSNSNQTSTLISSAPVFQILKTSQDMTGDANVLVAGDRLHYTITVKNIGNENAINVALRDLIPTYTSYVANTTRLNGALVADPSTGVSALQSGMLINPTGSTSGMMPADASATTANVATITFDVVVNADVLEGIFIANQGFVTGAGAGSGPFTDRPSDDPDTATSDDPTRDFVGNLPLIDASKLVTIQSDANANGAADVGDVLRYTITVNNLGTETATGVVLSDAIPANSSYEANTTRLNGQAVADPSAGVSALESGMAVNAVGSASGTVPDGANAVITFDVRVAASANSGDVISNQGYVASNELATEPTDVDGNDFNGDQPTTIVVGSAQQLTIVKQVLDLNGGVVEAGDILEYSVLVTNEGTITATQVVISDDLTPIATWVNYVPGFTTLNGATTGVSEAAGVVTADVGNLAVGATATLRFRVQLKDAAAVPIGTTFSNTAMVAWNTPQVSANSSVAVTVGGIPGTAMLSGQAWHDANFSDQLDGSELTLAGWQVEVWRNGTRLGSVTVAADGSYTISGLAPTEGGDLYEIRFRAPGAGTNTASLGEADSFFSTTPPAGFTDGPQRISGITATSGGLVPNLNMPIDPNGVVFNSISRAPVAGATLTLLRDGVAVVNNCFADPVQQGQVTLASGYYKFDLNFSDPACPAGADYVIQVTPPPTGYIAGPSRLVPPVSNDPAVDPAATPYAVAACTNDAVSAPADYCEAMASEFAPPLAVPASAVVHHLYLTLSPPVPNDSQLFNNHIAIDPRLDNALTISKTSPLVNVSRAQLVPYTITVNNTLPVTLSDLSIVDTLPPGFKYVAGSARVNGRPLDPVMTNRTLSWNNLTLATNQQYTIKLLLIVGSGVGEGEYINRAQAIHTVLDGAASGVAMATVRVVPDPTFDCSDIIGKVFDDANMNGYQDKGEKGLPGVRVVTARGLIITTDDKGRFHVSCAIAPDEQRGSNFIMKVDDRSLPTGYRITTENPRVQRVTRGKMIKFNFGATIHKVVRLDIANGVFTPNTTDMRVQWKPRLELLMNELKKARSTLRLAYMAEVEEESLVEERLAAMKQEIMRQWSQQNGGYELTIETEVFWRTGAPPTRSALK